MLKNTVVIILIAIYVLIIINAAQFPEKPLFTITSITNPFSLNTMIKTPLSF